MKSNTEVQSVNPHNGEILSTFKLLNSAQIDQALDLSAKAFESWKSTSIYDRCALMKRAGEVLLDRKDAFAEMISLEMGKPITEAKAEVTKCATACFYYADRAPTFLANKPIKTEASKSLVKYDPLGTIFAIMPWNYPFWQVFRFAAPTLTAGNVGVLKHASNVFGCAEMIESVFREAGFPEQVFQHLCIQSNQTEQVIAHPVVKAVTLTGSEKAGSEVASLAGKYLKKTVLELGGSNAFIVWEDADIESVISTAVTARMMNTGQSCIAAKRFILVGSMYEAFVPRFIDAVAQLQHGNPLDEGTEIGPMAREDLSEALSKQVQSSIQSGAKLLHGGGRKGAYHEPTVLGDVLPGMAAFDEETFGPLAVMIHATDIVHAFELSEQSKYGLGVTVCTTSVQQAFKMADRVSDGAYFINELVKSDVRLPFGGTKNSGYGRELSKDGIMEFVNRKTVYIK